MTDDQRIEVLRLANRLAMRRVRAYAVSVGRGPNETAEGTKRGVERAFDELNQFLETLP